MDNNTTYIDDFKTHKTKIKEWAEYFPKVKEGKKHLPKKYNYFKRRLYSERGNSFLLLSLRYGDEEDIFRQRITGSVKKWFLNGNTLEDPIMTKFETDILNLKKIKEDYGFSTRTIYRYRATGLKFSKNSMRGLVFVVRKDLEDFFKKRYV